MAVHAQYLSTAFVPDFQTITTTRITSDNNGLKDQQLIEQQAQALNGSAVLSSQKSDLSCNVNASSRKRNRGDMALMTDRRLQFLVPNKMQSVPNYKRNQLLGSAADKSTSGRPILPQSQLSSEIDQLIRLHSAKIRSGIDEIQRRHCGDFVRFIETQSAKKIAEKDAEIETLKGKQAELEARLKQVTAEGQLWFTAARNCESLVAGLKGSLDQALRLRGGAECHPAGAHAVEDAESCCYEGGSKDHRRPARGVCRVCNENSVSVLVLPCRHLCLCLQCEPVAETCPICCGAKNVGLQVLVE